MRAGRRRGPAGSTGWGWSTAPASETEGVGGDDDWATGGGVDVTGGLATDARSRSAMKMPAPTPSSTAASTTAITRIPCRGARARHRRSPAGAGPSAAGRGGRRGKDDGGGRAGGAGAAGAGRLAGRRERWVGAAAGSGAAGRVCRRGHRRRRRGDARRPRGAAVRRPPPIGSAAPVGRSSRRWCRSRRGPRVRSPGPRRAWGGCPGRWAPRTPGAASR